MSDPTSPVRVAAAPGGPAAPPTAVPAGARPPLAARIAVALLAAALAVALTVAVAPSIPRALFLVAFAAVTAAAWYGGTGAGVLAAAACVLGIDYWVIPPVGGLTPADPADLVPMAAFLAVAAFVGRVTDALRDARDAAAHAAAALAAANRELAARAAALAEGNEALRAQAAELEAQQAELEQTTQQLQDQQAELEVSSQHLQEQQAELEAQAEALGEANANLESALGDAVRARRAADAARRAAEAARARTAAVLEAMGDAYFALDGDFRIVAVNAAMARGTGIARDQLLGRDFWEAFPGAVGTAFETHYRAAAAGTARHFTHDYSDGRLDLVVDVDAYPAEGGGVAVFWRDVTQRVRAEADRTRLLAESEAARAAADLERRRLAATIEQLPVGVHIAEAPGGRLVLGNAAVRRIWGRAPASAGVDAYSDDYVATHRGGPRAGQAVASHEWPLARALATGEVVTDEVVEIARGDGSRALVSLSAAPVRDADGSVVGGVVTSADVTERERLLAAERLAAGRAQLLQELSAAFSAALTPEAVVRVVLEHGIPALGARTGLVLLTSADGAHLTLAGARGYPPGFEARFERLPLDAAFPVAAAARERRAIWIEDAEAGVRAYPDLAAVYAATGAGATAALPLADGAGRVVGALAFNFPAPRRFDAAARASKAAVARQCAQALERAHLFAAERAARAAAEQANAAKSQFLATMSHELRTPLNAIAGYAELLALGVRGPLTDAQRADLDRLRRANQHLTALVTDVLNFARLDAGQVEYRAEPVPIGSVVADLESLVGPQLAAKGLGYDHDGCTSATPAHPHVARADPDKVRQVLLNLLTNAIKFTDRGGRVTLACEDDPAAGLVRIRVRDTGRGIPAERLAQVFEPFVQVDRDLTHASQQGVGLGLAISRDLARGMGGDLTVESARGAGSTFTLTLPRA